MIIGLLLNAVDPITSLSSTYITSLDDKSELLIISRLSFYRESYQNDFLMIEMWVYSISPMHLRLMIDHSTNNGDLLSDRNHWKHT